MCYVSYDRKLKKVGTKEAPFDILLIRQVKHFDFTGMNGGFMIKPVGVSKSTASGKIQWARGNQSAIVFNFELESEHLSQRQFATENEIPRTTLQYWLSRKESLDSSPELIDFFESPCGIAFLHRLITAAHFEFTKNGPGSIHNISNFLKLSGLDVFVAASYSSQRKVSNEMDKTILLFGRSESKRLSREMPEKWLTLCEDETFHPDICMVAIEPVSNFIILEEYVESRDGETWNQVVGKALKEMPVKVVQVASDEAKGLKNHTEKGLGAHHSPDVFHVSHEIGKGTSGALASGIKKAEKQVEQAGKLTLKEMQAKKQYDNQSKRPPGRRPNFEKKIEEATEHVRQAEAALDTARQNQEIVQRAKRQIGECYHPYDPETGEKQGPEKVAELLEKNFEKIDGAITGLSERCKKRVEKAYRVVKDMVSNVAFFFLIINQYMDNIGITNERKIMHDYLIPGFYLQQVARKEKDEIRKETISDKSKEFLSILSDPDGPLAGYSDEKIEVLKKAAKDCAGFFQRSSSCVEGRNAQLSLRHHGIHRLSARLLKALTVVHNYHIKNKDGTTAAERFFEAKHNNLFQWLLDRMDFPARPRKRFTKAA